MFLRGITTFKLNKFIGFGILILIGRLCKQLNYIREEQTNIDLCLLKQSTDVSVDLICYWSVFERK